METRLLPQVKAAPPPSLTAAHAGLLQRKCACGGSPGIAGDCEGCSKSRLSLQRTTRNSELATRNSRSVPPIVHEVLRSPGQPLDATTRSFMEPRFGHDFSQVRPSSSAVQPMQSGLSIGPANDAFEQQADRTAERISSAQSAPTRGENVGYDFGDVRIHTGSAAAESARAIGASAYTVGRDVVFGAGRYAPHTGPGRHLLAHELTHVIQQVSGLHASPVAGGIVQRAISPELDEMESLLSYGLFDWAIKDSEAIRALEILKTLPKYQQGVFISNKKYLDRLRDNLPKDRIGELDAIIAGASDITPPSAEVEDIRSKLSYGLFDWVVTDKEAVESLEKLKQLKGTQLAVALGAINYGRLLDNLPDSRKQELIDLMAQSLGTGGAKETEEKTHPGSELSSIAFTSDHAVMKDNGENWANSGSVVQPEWSVGADGNVVNKPISQGKGTSLSVDVSLNVLPLGAPVAPISVRGESDEPALNFGFNGSMQGGLKQSVTMTSPGKLPETVTALRNKEVRWTMKWNDWEHEIARTAHTIYVTMDTPRDPGEVTIKRMAKAIEIIEPIGTLVPHEIVKGIMKNWNVYELSVPIHEPIWTFADDIARGGQCIDIVNFVMAVIKIVGCPGTAEAMVIWARPDAPTVPIESLAGTGGGMSSVPSRTEAGSVWGAALLDGSYHANNFEAALKFNHGGTLAYYPGGVDSVMTSPDQVLRVFRCLAWIEAVSGLNCRIKEVPANYPDNYGGDTCAPGMERTCFVVSG